MNHTEMKSSETIRPNHPNDTTTPDKCPTCTEEQKCWECAPDVSVPDTPTRCPHCESSWSNYSQAWECGSYPTHGRVSRPSKCRVLEQAQKSAEEVKKLQAEVVRLRGLLKAHAEFMVKNGHERQATDLMRGYTWSEGFVEEAKEHGIDPYKQ